MSEITLHDLRNNLTQAVKDNDSELLIRHLEDLPDGFDINFSIGKGNGHRTLFYIAAYYGYVEVIKTLLERDDIEVNQVDNNGYTPFLIAAGNGYVEVVQVLLEHDDIHVNQAHHNGCTPLFVASISGFAEVVQVLLAAGADVNQVNEDGSTPFFIATQHGRLEVVRLLLGREDIDVNLASDNDHWTPLLIAARNGHLEMVQALLEREDIDVNRAINNGFTPLLIAACGGHVDVIKMLLAAGAEVNRAINNGFTPLLIAACGGHVDVIKMLLAAGAEVNYATIEGYTSLLGAADEGHVEVIQVLIEAGAEITQDILEKLIRQINDISELGSLFDAIVKGYDKHLLKLAKRYQNQSTEEIIDIKSQIKSLHSKIMPGISSSLFEKIDTVVSTNLTTELLEDYNKPSFEFESLLNDRGILIESLGSLRGFFGDVGYDFYAQVIEILPSDDASKENSCTADETLLETLKGEFISSQDVRFLDLALNLVIEDKLNLENNSVRSNIAFQIDNIHAFLLQKKRLDVDTKVSLLVKFSAVALIIQDFDQRCDKETWGTHFNDDEDNEDESLSQTDERSTSEYSQKSVGQILIGNHSLWKKQEENDSLSDGEYECKENDNDCQY